MIVEEKKQKLKIAICLRGMLRTGIENRKTFKYFFESDFEVDFFYHTWSTERPAPPHLGESMDYEGTAIYNHLRSRKSYEVLYSKIKKFKNIYKPKLGIIEDLTSIKPLDLKQESGSKEPIPELFSLDFHPQYISAYKVDKLRREYEKANNFKYDLVINTRFDIIFFRKDKKQIYDNLIDLTKIKNGLAILNLLDNTNEDTEFIDDVFYAGSSDSMNIFIEHFNIDKNQKNHQYIFKYIIKNGLQPVGLNFTYCILRSYCSYLDPIDDAEDIFIDDHRLTYGTLDLHNALGVNKSMYKELLKRIDYGLL